MIFLKILTISFFITNSFFFHPVHVSVTNIDFQMNSDKFDISIKLFQDDFESIIKNKYGVELNLGKENELKNAEKYIKKYIIEHFKIKINKTDKTKSKLKLTSFKLSDLSVWLNIEYVKVGKIKDIEIENSLMTDLFFDQTNLLIFTYKEKQKAIKYSNSLLSTKIDLNQNN